MSSQTIITLLIAQRALLRLKPSRHIGYEGFHRRYAV
jgi:hypothetical protein